MALIEWREEYCTGIEGVDFEHEALIRQINTVYEMIEDRAGKALIIDSTRPTTSDCWTTSATLPMNSKHPSMPTIRRLSKGWLNGSSYTSKRTIHACIASPQCSHTKQLIHQP